jgi:hypothetical protein
MSEYISCISNEPISFISWDTTHLNECIKAWNFLFPWIITVILVDIMFVTHFCNPPPRYYIRIYANNNQTRDYCVEHCPLSVLYAWRSGSFLCAVSVFRRLSYWYTFSYRHNNFSMEVYRVGAGIAQWYSAGLRAGWSRVPIPARTGNEQPRPDRLWGPPSLLSNGYQRLLPLEVKRPGRETDQSLASSADVKNAWSYTFTPQIRFRGVVLS